MPKDILSLYQSHVPAVLRRCRRLLRDERRSVEVMHEVFVHLVNDIETSPRPITTSWLLILATQTCLDHIRAQGLVPGGKDDEILLRIAALSPAPRKSQSPLHRLSARLLAPRRQQTRLIAALAFLDQLSPEEIAQELALPEPRVRQTLLRLAQRWP